MMIFKHINYHTNVVVMAENTPHIKLRNSANLTVLGRVKFRDATVVGTEE